MFDVFDANNRVFLIRIITIIIPMFNYMGCSEEMVEQGVKQSFS